MSTIFTMQVTVEPKDEYGDNGAPGFIPDAVTVGSDLFDMVADWTKHESRLPYRVTTLAINQEGEQS